MAKFGFLASKRPNRVAKPGSPVFRTLPHLDVWDGQAHQEVHEDDADEDDKEEDHKVPGERKEGVAVLVHEVFVLYLAGHHHEGLDDGRHGLQRRVFKDRFQLLFRIVPA